MANHYEEVLLQIKSSLGGFNPDQAETIDKIIHYLRIAPFCYRPCSEEDAANRFYTAECKCGWWGSSKFLNGGGQIADTGGYSDSQCPVCGSYEIEVYPFDN